MTYVSMAAIGQRRDVKAAARRRCQCGGSRRRGGGAMYRPWWRGMWRQWRNDRVATKRMCRGGHEMWRRRYQTIWPVNGVTKA